MTSVPTELEKLGAILEALATSAEMFATQADGYSPAEMRGAFLVYSESLRAARGYVGAIQKLAEVTDEDQR